MGAQKEKKGKIFLQIWMPISPKLNKSKLSTLLILQD